MRRQLLSSVATLLLAALSAAQTGGIEQHLSEISQTKNWLILRSFYSGARLRYDATGTLTNYSASGDWSSEGIVRLNDFHFSHGRLILQAQRAEAVIEKQEFHLRLLDAPNGRNERRPVWVEIEIDLGRDDTPEKLDAAMAKIFLTSQDRLADLVPDYWKPCLSEGLAEKGPCRFSSELRAIPGVLSSEPSASTASTEDSDSSPASNMFHVEKGVRPPRAKFNREPEFSEPARLIRHQGTVTLGLTVTKEGLPTNVRILSPLGAGLDAQAVRAVEQWRFDPAEKDGQPVPAQIAIEMDFHLY
jgi:TonB family protein